MKKIFHVFLLLLFSVSALAYTETFYVSKDGTGAAPESESCLDAGPPTTCWDMADFNANQDIDVANDTKAGADDIAYFSNKEGTFIVGMDIKGSGTGTGTPLTIKNYDSETVTVDVGDNADIPLGFDYSSVGHDYVTIDGIVFQGGNVKTGEIRGFSTGDKASNIIIQNCFFYADHLGDSTDRVLYIRNVDSLTFRDNHIEYNTAYANAYENIDNIEVHDTTNSKGAVAFTGFGFYRNIFRGTTHEGISIAVTSSVISLHGNDFSIKYNSDANYRPYGRGFGLDGSDIWAFLNYVHDTRSRNQVRADNSYVYNNVIIDVDECCEAIKSGCTESYVALGGSCDAEATTQAIGVQSTLGGDSATMYIYHNTLKDITMGALVVLIESAQNDDYTVYWRNNASYYSMTDDTDSSNDTLDYPLAVYNWVNSSEWTITAENNLYFPYDSDYRPANDAVRYEPDNDIAAGYYQIPTEAYPTGEKEWNTDAEVAFSNATVDKERTIDWNPDGDGEPQAGSATIDYGKTGLSITGAPTISGSSSLAYGIKQDCIDWSDFVGTIEGCLVLRDASPDAGAFEFISSKPACIIGLELN